MRPFDLVTVGSAVTALALLLRTIFSRGTIRADAVGKIAGTSVTLLETAVQRTKSLDAKVAELEIRVDDLLEQLRVYRQYEFENTVLRRQIATVTKQLPQRALSETEVLDLRLRLEELAH